MSDDQMHPYEGLFLFPQAQTADLQAAIDHIEEIVQRSGGEVMTLKKWDERRLAYEIKGNKRGVYFLVYFKAQAPALTNIERDCNLSERMLRFMFLRADHIPQEVIDAADGREALADEIRVRGEQAQRAEEEQPDEEEPVEVSVVDPVASDAASSVER